MEYGRTHTRRQADSYGPGDPNKGVKLQLARPLFAGVRFTLYRRRC